MTRCSIELLGTGTSDGIPRLGCSCPVCCSEDLCDRRLRTSALLRIPGEAEQTIVIDTGPDFRQQALASRLSSLDAVLITHSHTDHLEGITELRPLSLFHGKEIPCFGTETTLKTIRQRFAYIFTPGKEGGGLPLIRLTKFDGPFELFGKKITPLPVLHGTEWITGFRFGELAYITDASRIPESTLSLMRGIKTLILNALRHKPHSTHFSIDEAVEFSRSCGAVRTRLVHLSHKVGHRALHKSLPENIRPAYDTERLTFRW